MNVNAGWDWYLAPQFQKRGWMNFPFIKSIWNRTNEFTETDWFNETESAGTIFCMVKKASASSTSLDKNYSHEN